VGALFARHSAIVLPYTSAFVAQSGVVFLALAHELPVVASDAGGLTELMQEFEIGITFRPSTPAALAEAVRRLHEPRRATGLAHRIGEARERCSWNANAATTLQGYRNVLEPYRDLNDRVAEATRAC
jgi:glycosyltransferase involved in cell wall biosynthesis